MRLIVRTIGAQSVGGNVDRVMVACPLPAGGKLLGVQGEVHVVGEENQSVHKFMAWGLSGHMVTVDEPESALGYGELWDQVVVKSADPTQAAATSTLDWDWDSDQQTPVELEPGEMDINALLGVRDGTKEFMPPVIEFVSFAKSRQGGYIADVGGSATGDTYLPTDYKTFRSKVNLTADAPSAVMIGFSSPVLDEVRGQGDHKTPGTSAEWYMMANLRETMRDMGKAQAGLIEADNDSPYANASALIQELVAPNMLDESSTMYNSVTWSVLVVSTWHLELPGETIPNTLDGR